MPLRSYNRSYPAHNIGVPQAPLVHTGERSPYWAEQAGRVFYVTVIDGPRKGILLGPYDTHREALDNVSHGRNLAESADPRVAFYAFGTCSAPRARPLRTVFEKGTS